MGLLQAMSPVVFDQADLAAWGRLWLGSTGSLKKSSRRGGTSSATVKKPGCFDRKQSMDFGMVFDKAFVAAMLGNKVMIPGTTRFFRLTPTVSRSARHASSAAFARRTTMPLIGLMGPAPSMTARP